jgi:hypothetical protein
VTKSGGSEFLLWDVYVLREGETFEYHDWSSPYWPVLGKDWGGFADVEVVAIRAPRSDDRAATVLLAPPGETLPPNMQAVADEPRPLIVAVDQGANLKVLRRLQREGRILLVQAHTLEQRFRGVREQGRAFRIGHSRIGGPDRIAGENVRVVEEVVGEKNLADVDHVYAAWLNQNDYFVTENVGDFIAGDRRARLEEALSPLLIRTTVELEHDLTAGS